MILNASVLSRTIFLGIDLHSNSFTCCYIMPDGVKKRASYSFHTDSFAEFIQTLSKETIVLIEASTTAFTFYDMIEPFVYKVHIANTHKLALISQTKKKTDKIDAEKLAIYLKSQVLGGEELFNCVFVPPLIIRELRSLFTTYSLIKKNIASQKNRIHSLNKQALMQLSKSDLFSKRKRSFTVEQMSDSFLQFQVKNCYDVIDALKDSQVKIVSEILLKGQILRKEIDVLTSMNGISVFIAVALLADIADINRFKNSKCLSSYLRSAPGIDSSNETTRHLKTMKYGRKLSITLIAQALNVFRDMNPKLEHWYDKKVSHEKPKGKIRMALCRKVITEVYQMLKKSEYHRNRNELKHSKKMKAYDTFLVTSKLTSALYNRSR